MVISQADLCKHLSDRILWRLATMQDDEKVPMLPLQYHQIPLAVRQQCNAPIGRGTFRCECKLLLSIASLGLGLTRRKFCRLQVKVALVFCYEKEPCILLFGTYEECAEIGTFLGGAPVQRRPLRKLAQTPNTGHTPCIGPGLYFGLHLPLLSLWGKDVRAGFEQWGAHPKSDIGAHEANETLSSNYADPTYLANDNRESKSQPTVSHGYQLVRSTVPRVKPENASTDEYPSSYSGHAVATFAPTAVPMYSTEQHGTHEDDSLYYDSHAHAHVSVAPEHHSSDSADSVGTFTSASTKTLMYSTEQSVPSLTQPPYYASHEHVSPEHPFADAQSPEHHSSGSSYSVATLAPTGGLMYSTEQQGPGQIRSLYYDSHAHMPSGDPLSDESLSPDYASTYSVATHAQSPDYHSSGSEQHGPGQSRSLYYNSHAHMSSGDPFPDESLSPEYASSEPSYAIATNQPSASFDGPGYLPRQSVPSQAQPPYYDSHAHH